MPYRVSFEMWGKGFRPSRVPFRFTEQHDPGAIGTVGRYRGEPLPYGSASYVVPASVPNTDRIKHAVQIIEPLLAGIRDAGATDWHISIGRYYSSQCNEAYSLEELQLIARLRCGFTYSAYSVTEEDEAEWKRKLESREPVA
jgi:hypothetical protein